MWSPRTSWAARLNAIAFVDPVRAGVLLEQLGPEKLFYAPHEEWASAAGIGIDRAARWRREAMAFDIEGEFKRAEALGARFIARGDPEYPALLASTSNGPVGLYVIGTFSAQGTVAVVGSRAPTDYGRRMSSRLAKALAERGIVVVSGLARGIDAQAHQAALDAGGQTWAVLGSGLGVPYPPENVDLYKRIVATEGCAVISEYPLSTRPGAAAFLHRNRIIAGLSWATVVVEGREKSGALTTADNALAYGREVLAVPGPADSPLSFAPHYLLKNGARMATHVGDILGALPPAYAKGSAPTRRRSTSTDGQESKILGFLEAESLSLDELGRRSGLDMPSLSLILFGLEIKELVCAVPGQRYAKKAF